MPNSNTNAPNHEPQLVTLDLSDAHHSYVEDGIAMLIGTLITSFGLMLMQHAHLLMGGTVGLALLLHYMTGYNFSVVFFLTNLPFYYLAYRKLGKAMLIKTVIAVALLSAMTPLHPYFIEVTQLNPLYTAVFANVLIGLGLLILFRHRTSLGGFGILAIYLQERYKIPAGKVQMGIDVVILLVSCLYVSLPLLLISIVGAMIFNLILTMNHRPDRYVGF